jgi:hypothetical protein
MMKSNSKLSKTRMIVLLNFKINKYSRETLRKIVQLMEIILMREVNLQITILITSPSNQLRVKILKNNRVIWMKGQSSLQKAILMKDQSSQRHL